MKPRKSNGGSWQSGCVPSGPRAEVDEARLVRMEREPIASKPLPQHFQHPFAVVVVLEGHHEVIGEPHQGTRPRHARLHLALEPFVQHVMQEDVREQRRDDPALRRALRRRPQEPVFQNSRLQPFVDHPTDHAVRDPLVEECTQLVVRDRVEVLAYVDVQHPVQPPPALIAPYSSCSA